MKLVFIDEVHGSKEKNLFGLGVLVVDATKYNYLYKSFYKTLKKHSWPEAKEIKGKYIFSRDPAQTGKTPEQMIELTRDLTSHLLSDKSSRGELFFIFNRKGYSVANYVALATTALTKLARCGTQKNGKHLVLCFLDDFNDLHPNHLLISNQLQKSIEARKYCLIDGTFSIVKSSNNSPVVVYADLLAYLARWVVENPNIEAENLFDLVVPDTGAVNKQKTLIARNLLFNRVKGYIIES